MSHNSPLLTKACAQKLISFHKNQHGGVSDTCEELKFDVWTILANYTMWVDPDRNWSSVHEIFDVWTVHFVYPIQTTWWLRGNFFWHFNFCTFMCTHKFWKDKGNILLSTWSGKTKYKLKALMIELNSMHGIRFSASSCISSSISPKWNRHLWRNS